MSSVSCPESPPRRSPLAPSTRFDPVRGRYIFALSAGYNRPISNRWRLGFGAFYVDDMIDDDNRTITLRLDSIWSAGVGFEWQWKDRRAISASLNYLKIDDAPLTSPELPGIGSMTGSFTDRRTIYLQIGMSVGSGAR